MLYHLEELEKQSNDISLSKLIKKLESPNNEVDKYFPFNIQYFLFGADYTVYSWGYGDILGETLQMIAFLFHYDDYKGCMEINIIISIICRCYGNGYT